MGKSKMTLDENDFSVGLQTSADVMKFMKSKVGQEIIDEIIKQYDELIEKIQAGMEQAREEELELAQIRSFVHAHKDKPEHHAAEESVFEKLHKQQQKTEAAYIAPSKAPKADPYNDMLTKFNKQVHKLETQKANTEQEYSRYNDSLEKSDEFIADLDLDDPDGAKMSLEARIAKLKAAYDLDAEKTMADADAGNMPEAQAGLARLRAQALELTQLQEMLSVINNEKIMYKKDGTLADTFAEADFLVKKDQQLIKDGDDYYLLDNVDKDGNKITLNDSNREAAKQAFERAQSGMINLGDLVKNNKSIDMAHIEEELQNTRIVRSQHVNNEPVSPAAPAMTALADTGIKPSLHIEESHLDLGNSSGNTASTTSDPELKEDSAPQINV